MPFVQKIMIMTFTVYGYKVISCPLKEIKRYAIRQ